MKNPKPKLIVILGPTASGKTDLAVKLARKFKGEIVSADSRQVYKGMDIGTAKALQNKKSKMTLRGAGNGYKNKKYITSGIAHHLIDIIKPNRQFNVVLYKNKAIGAIRAIIERKKNPFLVGGTGLYIQAIADNIIFPGIRADQKLRENLEKKTAKALYKIYRKLDPRGAGLIDKKNKRRLIRAIEVSKITGRPFWKQRKKEEPIFEVLQIGIKLPKKEFKKRVEKRVEKMINSGLEKEVKKLVKKYGWVPPLLSIGYREWKEYFENKTDKEEVKKQIIVHTGQFAKRQMTWFKRDKRIRWVKNQKEAERLVNHFLKRKRS